MALQTQSRDQIQAWLQAFHHAADSLTTTSLHKFYSKDSTLVFANNEPLISLDNIIKFFDSIFPLLESMKHEIVDFDAVGDKIYQTCTITYGVKHDPAAEKFKIPAVGVFYLLPEKRGDEEAVIEKFEVYLDAGPIMARIAQVAAARNGEGDGKI